MSPDRRRLPTQLTSGTLLLLLFAVVPAQKTYQRGCECEYMVNGKCAYTMLLPVQSTGSSSNDVTNGCDVTLSNTVRELAQNVSYFWQWSLNQSTIVSQLQQVVIQLMNNVNAPSPTDQTDRISMLNETLREYVRQLGDVEKMAALVESLSTILESLESSMKLGNDTNGQSGQLLAKQTVRISRLTTEVQRLSRLPSACSRRSRLFSGPNRLTNGNVTVSSVFDDTFGVDSVLIDFEGAWCPQEPNANEWVAFDMGSKRWVYAVVTRGRSNVDQWASSYKLQYHVNGTGNGNGKGNTTDDSFWTTFTDEIDDEQVFTGNEDRNTIKVNVLWQPVLTRHVRLVPLTGAELQGKGNKCLRADLIGCLDPVEEDDL